MQKNYSAVKVIIAVLLLIIGIGLVVYCYNWNHNAYESMLEWEFTAEMVEGQTEIQHGFEYGYYTAAVIGTPICIVLAGLLLYSVKKPLQPEQKAKIREMLTSPQKKREREYEESKAKYRAIIGKLPSDLARKLHKLLGTAGLSMGLPSEELPDELCKVLAAANAIVKSGSYGTITDEQHLKINELLKDFEWVVKTDIPAWKQAVNALHDSDGLGFDLITNRAASAALYTAMNTHDKIKGNERRIDEFKQSVDQKVISLVEGIRQVVF